MYEQYDHEIILQKIVSALQIDIIKAKLIQQNQGLAAAFTTATGKYGTIYSHRYNRATLSFLTTNLEKIINPLRSQNPEQKRVGFK